MVGSCYNSVEDAIQLVKFVADFNVVSYTLNLHKEDLCTIKREIGTSGFIFLRMVTSFISSVTTYTVYMNKELA